MRITVKSLKPILYYLPTISVVIFVILYIISTQYYPGGSYKYPKQEGFSWTYNYWCNLLSRYAINGQLNPARPYGLIGTVFLCGGIGSFFALYSKHFSLKHFWQKTIEVSGVGSMVSAVFLFTAYHDQVLTIAGILGGVALIGTMRALLTDSVHSMFWLGLLCFLLILANAYMYYFDILSDYLPLLQKITMLATIIWIVRLNYQYIVKFRRP